MEIGSAKYQYVQSMKGLLHGIMLLEEPLLLLTAADPAIDMPWELRKLMVSSRLDLMALKTKLEAVLLHVNDEP